MWTRDSTKDWLFHIQSRLTDFEFYLKETADWCETHAVFNDAAVFMCYVMTLIWVSHMREESLTKNEVFEILGFDQYEYDNSVYELGSEFYHLDHHSMLSKVVRDFSDD